jgi:cephalosporin hydroxylase
MFADFCAIAGNGRVISIDISPMGTPEHDKVTYIKGSSIDPGVVEEVKGLIGKDKVMVVLDSDHSYYHVKREMEIYSDLVTPSSILVVEDANTMTSVWQAIEDFSDARFAPLKQPVAVAATWFIRAEI